MKNRRQFLAVSSAMLAGAALPKSLLAQRQGGEVFTNQSIAPYVQGEIRAAHFEKVVGSQFTIFLEKNAIGMLRLEAVTKSSDDDTKRRDLPAYSRRAMAAVQPKSFQLQFSVHGPAFAQDSYLLDHGTMGRMAMFLVPGQSGATCTASFSAFDS